MRTSTLVIAAAILGALAALFIPAEFMLALILLPFTACIILAWYVAFQNKTIQLTPFRLFGWPWVNVSAPFKASRALRALYMCVAIVAGTCFGLLIQAANA